MALKVYSVRHRRVSVGLSISWCIGYDKKRTRNSRETSRQQSQSGRRADPGISTSPPHRARIVQKEFGSRATGRGGWSFILHAFIDVIFEIHKAADLSPESSSNSSIELSLLSSPILPLPPRFYSHRHISSPFPLISLSANQKEFRGIHHKVSY